MVKYSHKQANRKHVPLVLWGSIVRAYKDRVSSVMCCARELALVIHPGCGHGFMHSEIMSQCMYIIIYHRHRQKPCNGANCPCSVKLSYFDHSSNKVLRIYPHPVVKEFFCRRPRFYSQCESQIKPRRVLLGFLKPGHKRKNAHILCTRILKASRLNG